MRTKVFLKDKVMEAENHSKKQGATENPKSRINILMCIAVALAFVFSACDKDLDEGGVKAKETVSSVKWYGDSDIAVAVDVLEKASDRKNASGAKITSNAHSADFPGIYFIWDSKQKDNGYLKVDAEVFDKYVGFTLTSKESNTYWDFDISIQPGQKKTEDNCYVFYIPKVYNNKNINMVFVGAFVEKTIIVVNDPPIVEADGCKTTISIISGAKRNDIIVDPADIWNGSGTWDTDIKNVWNAGISTSPYYAAMTGITAKVDEESKTANWIWHRMDSWETGFTGSNLINTVNEFTIVGDIVESEVMFYFACDNAAVLFVNGNRVTYTPSLEGKWIPENPNQMFSDFTSDAFDDNSWQHIVAVDIRGYLKEGPNKIVIVAANNDENGGMYNTDNNPAGLIYACQFTVGKDCNSDVEPVVRLGFIGYYLNDGDVLSTSIHWQYLEEGDCIDWDAVDAAYADWVAQGGLVPERAVWQTSGGSSFTFGDKAKICFEDFTLEQIEGYYLNWYVDPGYISLPE